MVPGPDIPVGSCGQIRTPVTTRYIAISHLNREEERRPMAQRQRGVTRPLGSDYTIVSAGGESELNSRLR
jgi:hypothetical protein